MHTKNLNSFNQESLASFLMEDIRPTEKNYKKSVNKKGINIGFEGESKKARKNKLPKINIEEIEDEEERSVHSNITLQSTTNSDISSLKSVISEEKSVLGKRKGCPLLEGCNSIENYRLLNYIHEGVYGSVYRAQDQLTGKIHAIKKVKLNLEKEGFPITSLREISLLQTLRHPNIINIKEVVMGKSLDEIFLVTEYAEHELRDLVQNYNFRFSIPEIKCLMKQLLEALAYLHGKDIVHRDLKTSNLLYTSKGLLKVCDFGLSRKMANTRRWYTPTVVTLGYRAPEILLGASSYTSKIDLWAAGCVLAELLLREPLFRAKGEMEQIDLIFRTFGTPTTTTWPGWKELKFASFFEGKTYTVNKLYEIFAGLSFGQGVRLSDNGIDLLEQLLTYDPSKRINATEALKHPWFSEEPLVTEVQDMPIFEATNEEPRESRKKLFTNEMKDRN